MRFSAESHSEREAAAGKPFAAADSASWRRQASRSHVVPPPDPNLLPMGSDVQNHCEASVCVISWKHATKLGGRDNSRFMRSNLSRQILRTKLHNFFETDKQNGQKNTLLKITYFFFAFSDTKSYLCSLIIN
jgi:hypothetical protein